MCGFSATGAGVAGDTVSVGLAPPSGGATLTLTIPYTGLIALGLGLMGHGTCVAGTAYDNYMNMGR